MTNKPLIDHVMYTYGLWVDFAALAFADAFPDVFPDLDDGSALAILASRDEEALPDLEPVGGSVG